MTDADTVTNLQMRGSLAGLSLNPVHTFSKLPVAQLRLVAGEGVEGDCHRGRTTQHLYRVRRTPMLPNLCQVHLLAEERLAEWSAAGFELRPGEFGENLLTRGLDLHALPPGTLICAGEGAVLEITGERTPCAKIDAFRPGLQALCWGEPPVASGRKLRRAGIMAVVRTGGEVHPGDGLMVTLPAKPWHPLPAV